MYNNGRDISAQQSPARHGAGRGMMLWWLLAHGSYEPFFIWGESPEAFAVTAQVPLVGDLILAEGQSLKTFILNQHPLSSAEASVTLLLSALLRTSEVGARWRSLFTLAHSVSNVMGGRILSMRRPVKHYEAVDSRNRNSCVTDIIRSNICLSYQFVNLLNKSSRRVINQDVRVEKYPLHRPIMCAKCSSRAISSSVMFTMPRSFLNSAGTCLFAFGSSCSVRNITKRCLSSGVNSCISPIYGATRVDFNLCIVVIILTCLGFGCKVTNNIRIKH